MVPNRRKLLVVASVGSSGYQCEGVFFFVFAGSATERDGWEGQLPVEVVDLGPFKEVVERTWTVFWV